MKKKESYEPLIQKNKVPTKTKVPKNKILPQTIEIQKQNIVDPSLRKIKKSQKTKPKPKGESKQIIKKKEQLLPSQPFPKNIKKSKQEISLPFPKKTKAKKQTDLLSTKN